MTTQATQESDQTTLGRYAEIARLVVKHGRVEWLKAASIELDEVQVEPGAPESLVDDLEALGPTFIKLGQMLSTRPDLIPAPYVDALSRLQQDVFPVPGDVIVEVIESQLGARVSKLFGSFEIEPIASASLGQVHRATLQSGRTVAVKVQRPNIRETIDRDLKIMDQIATALDRHTELGETIGLKNVVEEFRRGLLRELDYEVESKSLERLADDLSGHSLIVVPSPVPDYTTEKVLTMEFVDGETIKSIGPLRRMEIGGAELADELFSAYLDQILVYGLVHADPHPGNLMLTSDNRLALLDLGMVTELSREMREKLLKLMVAIASGRSSDAAEILMDMGTLRIEVDRRTFQRGVARLIQRARMSTVQTLEFGRLMIELVRLTTDSGIRPSPELALLAKTLLQLEQAAASLDPDFDPMEALDRHTRGVLRQTLLSSLSPDSVASAGLEVKELIENLPKRLNSFFGDLAENRLRVNLDVIDEERLLKSLQSMANRLSVSIVLASLIMGASLAMRIESSLTFFGYPVIASAFFAMAAACGFYLVFSVFRGDRLSQKRPPRQ